MSETKDTIINLRASERQRDLIDRAAQANGQTRASFVLDAATERATTVLLDRTRFVLTPSQFSAFQRMLDEPLPDPSALRRLFLARAPWEQE